MRITAPLVQLHFDTAARQQDAEQATGRSLSVDHVAEDALRAQLKAATDSMQQTFAGLMLYYAHGEAIDMATPLQTFPIGRLTSVSEYFARLQE